MNTKVLLRHLAVFALVLSMTVSFALCVQASDDNSLADLGIKTQGATVTPEFRYDIWEYSVQVPAGTKELELAPHTTNPSATVNSVTGTQLNADGSGQVVITVTSESGNAVEYVLNVTAARAPQDPAAAIAANESSSAVTIDTEVVQSEVETEDPRYVKVDRNSLEDARNTIEKLQKEITSQREHIRVLTYVLYGLIAVSIVFLFIVISLLLRKRDLSHELREYRQGDPSRGKGAPANAPAADDGWGDWGDEEESASSGKSSGKKKKDKKNKKKNRDIDEDDWGDEDDGSASSWTDAQIGTPVRPQKTPVQPQQVPAQQKKAPAPKQKASYAGSDDTKMYRTAQPGRTQNVPKDVTKDLSRVNKAEAKAMKKAAAAEAKAQEDARRAAAARAAEAKRQAEQAKRLEQQNEAKRQAQEKALEEAARKNESRQKASPDAAAKTSGDGRKNSGKNVEIDMIDL